MYRFQFILMTSVLTLVWSIAPPVHSVLAWKQTSVQSDTTLTLVVMDPLCDKLACDCVQGYAQRKYEELGKFLQDKLGQQVKVFWGESVQAALEDTDLTPDLIIGKHSVVLANTRDGKAGFSPVAQLTGSDGSVMQTGLFVVRQEDPATQVQDLEGYRIFFGPRDCDEKYAAPMQLLKDNGVTIPAKLEISGACSEAATKLMELESGTPAAAVISSYAEPLLAGCGTIQKGDLRIVGISDEVPFVSAFVNNSLGQDVQEAIKASLLEVGENAELLKALQTQKGFIAFESRPGPLVELTSAESGRTGHEPIGSGKKN